ncbi:flagellar hook-length control protein FliK [Pantoea sp. Bo_2]|uniref:flagellar hook-length control protein FliK n=1 Tax=unclassified Pantoea TaxID=2630326 RepID=UPI00123232B0|nr:MULTISPECIES: flagellar hook-length control protein FliK [unclassified Pantoea]KAA5940974.1 flagellar hook-length control protein FliK [Pantoea sp. VH_3]KAA5949136.1 flagellar hook-length control protein FliK [Pantoea sp. VH_25]KAA5951824.1 flagellar hook-length control protein FliK [Pantoea sp. VH_24]KAA5957811.1 flagellar hook-length control protein FliK [Pantoea sp. VH_16]KAA5961255.1 flagellar hook-length control protein FliK [Pantoea sp. VH_18]
MITLPHIGIKAAAKTDAEPSGATDLAAGADALPQDFLTTLGNQLAGLAKQQGKAAQSADVKAETADDARPKAPLNALMAALDNPAELTALFKPENIKAGIKSADDKDKPEAATLSASDMQNVQALFAMLPVAVTPTATPSTPVSSEAGELIAQTDTGRKSQTSLTQLLNSAQQSHAPDNPVPGKDEKHDAKGAALNSPVVNSTASQNQPAAQSATNSSLTLDSSFQQALSTMVKQDDQGAIKASTSDNAISATPFASASSLPAPVTASATSSTPSTPMLNSQLGSDEWQQALSQQIVMFSRNGQQNAELRLHPEDLGAIQISLKLDNDQAQINLVSSHSHVRSALEAAIPQLRSALAESGINLGESQVSSDSSTQGQQFQQQQEARRDGQHGRFSLTQDSDTDITPIAVPAALQARVSGNSAVDTFA